MTLDFPFYCTTIKDYMQDILFHHKVYIGRILSQRSRRINKVKRKFELKLWKTFMKVFFYDGHKWYKIQPWHRKRRMLKK